MFLPRRNAKKIRPTRRMVGPKPSRRFSHQGAPVSSGCALITTCLRWSSCESAFVSANAGISVLNAVVFFEPL